MTAKVKKIHEEMATAEEFEKAREAAQEAWEHFQEARSHMQSAAVAAGVELRENANEQFEETLATLKDKQSELQDKGNDLVDQGSDYVRANPVKSAGIAFAAGYVVSRLFR